MAPTSQADCLADLQERIDVTKAQLSSLDQEDEEYAGTKMLLEHGLITLEEKYEAAERGEITSQHDADLEAPGEFYQPALPIIGNQRPQTSDGTVGSNSNGFAGYAGPSLSGFGSHFASDSAVTARRELPMWGFDGAQDIGSPLDSGASPGDQENSASGTGFFSSPDAGFVRPPQKRQRESLGLSNDLFGHPSKSMRTTPSPARTATTTPTSLSSFEFPDDPGLLALVGGNPAQDLRDMKEEQKAQERIMEARKQQERADEEYARQLMEQDYDLSSFENSSRPGSSAIARGTSQTYLDNQGRFQRPTPYPLPSSAVAKVESPLLAPSLPVKQENSHRNHHPSIKNEGSFQSSYHSLPSSDFIDLENDELFDGRLNSVQDHPSSDLIEIDPSAFNGKSQNYIPTAGSYNAHGNSANGGSSGWTFPGGQLGQSLVNTASSVVNGAYNLLDNQIGSYSRIPMGFDGTQGYGSNGQGSSIDIIDLDSDNQFPHMPHDLFTRHGINTQDPANRDLVASFQDRIDYVANDPTRTSAEIRTLLENIRPDEDLPPENREGTPEAMTYPLMEHQKLGLTWLKSMEEGSNKGGILADEMGLGKTIQALALMVANKSTDRACKTTLIICPVALLKQWDREIQSKLKPTHQLKVYTLHGEKRHADWAKLRSFDVVLTTFGKLCRLTEPDVAALTLAGTLGMEVKRRQDIEKSKKANPNWRPSGKSDYLPLLGDECQWFRVIVDEAQCIKNKNTKAALGAAMLQAKTRFCMTGTPMMVRLITLLHMVMSTVGSEPDLFVLWDVVAAPSFIVLRESG